MDYSPVAPAKPMSRAKELITAPLRSIDPSAQHDEPDVATGAAADHRPPCPCCGGRMIIVESFGRGGAPRARRHPKPAAAAQSHDPVTASPRIPPAPELRFRRCKAVAPPSPKGIRRIVDQAKIAPSTTAPATKSLLLSSCCHRPRQ
jgi:hypothetical protein